MVDHTTAGGQSETDLDLTRGQAVSWIVGWGGLAVSLLPFAFTRRPDDGPSVITTVILSASVAILFIGYGVSRSLQEPAWRSRLAMFRSLGYGGSRWEPGDQTKQAATRLGLDPRKVVLTLQVLLIVAGAAFVIGGIRLLSSPRPR